MWLCLMDSELIKFTQEIEAPHHHRDIMAECVCVCGLTHTHASALSSKHKFVSNHAIVCVLHERIRGEQQAPVGLSIWVCLLLCFLFLFFFLDRSLSRPLQLSLNTGPSFIPSNLRVFLSIPPFLSVLTDLLALPLYAHFTVCFAVFECEDARTLGGKIKEQDVLLVIRQNTLRLKMKLLKGLERDCLEKEQKQVGKWSGKRIELQHWLRVRMSLIWGRCSCAESRINIHQTINAALKMPLESKLQCHLRVQSELL